MYVLLFLLVPVLFLFNTYLAMGALAVAIVVMYNEHTRPSRHRIARHDPDSDYTPGYED